jgi:uncharacterized cupredoxin-like copper-binding protein
MTRSPVPAGAALAAAAVLASGCGSTGGPPTVSHSSKRPGTTIATDLTDFKVSVPAASVSGSHVTFYVRNKGKVPHELLVLKTRKPAAKLGGGSQVKETGKVGATGVLKPGKAKRLTVVLKPGHYSLICNLPGHYSDGMHADFSVK